MKRITAALTAASMLLTCSLSALPAMAAGDNRPLTFFEYEDYAVVHNCSDYATEVVIPAEYNGLPVTKIDSYAFEDCSELTKVVMPDSIVSIGSEAFDGCEKLSEIEFSENLTDISLDAFKNTAWYESQPDGVVYIGTLAYNIKASETGFYELDIKEGTTKICSGFSYNLKYADIYDLRLYYYYSLNIPASVTDIAYGESFYHCRSITVAEDNPAYTSVDGVLYDKDMTTLLACPNLQSEDLSVPDGVQTIGGRAFADVGSPLVEIYFPETLTRIESRAFEESAFYTVTLPESVEYIGDSAFANSLLTEMHIPASVTELNGTIFLSCTRLQSLTVAEDNPRYEMRNGMLYDTQEDEVVVCPSRISGKAEIPEGTKSIGDYAFYFCYLNELVIPASVTAINQYAFRNCSHLKTVHYAGTEEMWEAVNIESNNVDLLYSAEIIFDGYVTEMPEDPETPDYSSLLEFNVYEDYAVVDACAEDATEIVIPAEYEGVPVVGIGANAFKNCTELTKVVMPDSITSISFDAFSGCEKLADITFSQNLTSIGSDALEDTAWYQNHPDGVIYLGNLAYAYTFSEEGNFTVDIKEGTTKIMGSFGEVPFGQSFDDHYYTLNIPASVTEIDITGGAIGEKCIAVNVAEDNENYSSIDGVLFSKDITELLVFPMEMEVTSYTVPDGVTTIAYMAFNMQEHVEEIVLSDSVESIEDSAFMSVKNLKSITLSENLKYIGANAFFGNYFLEDAVLPEGLETIEQSAFAYCDELKEMHVPASVTEIDFGVFRSCLNLAALTVAEDNPRYEMRNGMLYDKQDMILKQRLVTASGEAVIPEGTKDIDEYAFADTDITQISIPEGVEVLRESVFSGCKNLTAISLPTTLTLVQDWAFNDCEALETVNYAGTEEMWAAVEIETFLNDTLLDATVNFGGNVPETPEVTLGDLNASGTVDATDAAILLVAAAEKGAGKDHGLTDAQTAAADLDGDGLFDARDAALILQYAAYAGAGGEQTLEEFLAES